MIAIRGASSQIAVELMAIVNAKRSPPADEPPTSRHLFCTGLLRPERIASQTDAQMSETFMVNAGWVMQECDRILFVDSTARICVIGSESGFAWSHDGAYAAAKAALHRYVETKRLLDERQQLVCVAPGIIGDAGMTTRRTDTDNLERRREAHPKRRFLTSAEVAAMVYHLLYVDRGYTSGVVIRMNGGEHTCR